MKNLIIIIISGIGLLSSCKEKETVTSEAIQWLEIEEGLKFDNKEGKPYLVQIVTDSCQWCDIMDKNCFSHPELVNYLNTNYIPIKFNILHKDTLDFNGKKYGVRQIGRAKLHTLAEEWLFYWYSYPTTVIMDKNFNRITKFSGWKDPSEFLLELKKL